MPAAGEMGADQEPLGEEMCHILMAITAPLPSATPSARGQQEASPRHRLSDTILNAFLL